MKCDEYQEQISQLIDDELRDEPFQPLMQHTSECEECRSFLRNNLRLRQALQETDDLKERKSRVARMAVSAKPISFFQRRVSFSAPIATLIFVLTLAGSMVLSWLWFGTKGEPEVIYKASYPIVEVRGYDVVPKIMNQ